MKKALIVANLAGFGSFLLSDMDILHEYGYEVYFAANASNHEWEDTRNELEKRNVRFFHIDFDTKNPFTKQNYSAYKQISKILKLEKIDLVHCHTSIAGIVTRLAAVKYRKRGMKVIYTTHGFAFTSNSSKKAWFLYRTVESVGSLFCDAIITINREDFANAKKLHCNKVYYIPGAGVDTDVYRHVNINRAEYRRSIGVKDDEIMILSVGELSERKNHQIIIEALSRIQNKEKYVYVICGSGINGGTCQYLKKMAEEKKVTLYLLGFRMDIPEITVCSDIGAIPSLREGLGFAGVQSLAAGIPVVGTDVQGIRDYILNDKTGYLCKKNDSDAFAEAILLLSDSAKRESMKNDCIKTSEKFDIAASINQRKKIYKEILT